jgi:hypothetical protein
VSKPMLEVINEALREAGYRCRVEGHVYISLDLPPASYDDALSDRYWRGLDRIPGVNSDEGQGDGYSFQIEPGEFTRASEKRLIALIGRMAAASSPSSTPCPSEQEQP